MQNNVVSINSVQQQKISVQEQEEWANLFLTELGRGLPDDERVMVVYSSEAAAMKREDGSNGNAGFYPRPWSPGAAIDAFAKNCFVCISSARKTPHPKTGIPRYWRSEANAARGLALMVDDIGSGIGSKGEMTLADFKRLPPTAVIETSPGNHQLWWFIHHETEIPYFKAFLEAFVTKVLDKGGDRTIKDVTRIGRLPCGHNNKRTPSEEGAPFKYADPETGKPWRVRLRHFKPELRYSIDDIATAYNFTVSLRAPKVKLEIDPSQKTDDDRMNDRLLALAERIMGAAGMGEHGKPVQPNGRGVYRIQCPWGHEHSSAVDGAYFRGPIPGAEFDYVFGCAHDTCIKAGRKWARFIDEVIMPVVESELDVINDAFTKGALNNWIPKMDKSNSKAVL